jgi:hypothetical protein
MCYLRPSGTIIVMYFLTVNVAPNQVQIPSDIYVVTAVNSLNPIQVYI